MATEPRRTQKRRSSETELTPQVSPTEAKPREKSAPPPKPRRPNVFYIITLFLSLGVAAVPFILSTLATGSVPSIGFIDALGAVTAGVLFWTAAMLGLVKSIRIFGCMVGGTIAAAIATPTLAMLLYGKSSGQTPSAWIAMASFALLFSGAALVLWFVLGAVCTRVDKWLQRHRAALALDFFLGAGLGLVLIMALSVVYSLVVPEMNYTRFWKSKAEEIQKEAEKLK